MCIGCSRGFEIVDLESLDTQGLLDPLDESLEFVRKRENLRPMSIYRIHNEFLLCYDGQFSYMPVKFNILPDCDRVCFLREQERTPVTKRFYGALGGDTHWLWLVYNV